MNANLLEIIALAEEGATLLSHARELISTVPLDEVSRLAGRIPESIEGEGGPLKVVFAGQYSAGKSSVISALTGRNDIPIGAGITTQHTTAYAWKGVEVIDTPGVHTSKRPDHDEIGYRAIAEADLIVFATTNELFDSHLAEHFRKLAIDRDKGHEMLLLINKMQRHVKGNSPAAQAVVLEDLRKVLLPFSPEELRISFVDAKSALDARAAGVQADMAEVLLRKSGIEKFSHNLNEFIREKGLVARYTTALYALEQVLQEALAKASSGDIDVDALEELLIQRRRALDEERQKLPEIIRHKVEEVTREVRSEGRKLADLIHGEADTEAVNARFKRAQEQVEGAPEALSKALTEVLGERQEALHKRFEGILDSELGRELLPRLQKRAEEYLARSEMDPDLVKRLGQGAELSQKFGKFLVDSSFKPGSSSLKAIFELRNYSGTDTHKAVLAVGKFFGKKFKPWEAVKWAKFTANAGRVLAVGGVVVSLVLTWREDVKEAEREKELAEARAATRFGFSDAANAIETFFDEVTNTYIAEAINPDIDEVNRQLEELRAMQTSRSENYQAMVRLLADTQALIRRIHQTQESSQADIA